MRNMAWFSAGVQGRKSSSLSPLLISGIGLLLLVLPACLDLPVQGTVAGESMNFVSSQWLVSSPIIVGNDEGVDAIGQIILSDEQLTCADVAGAAMPGFEGHSLGLTLKGAGSDVGVGTYSVQAGAEGSAVSATFLFARGSRVIEDYAVAGEVEISAISQDLVQGYFSLTFENGYLDGVFNSVRCGTE